MKKIFFNFSYLFKPRWDTGVPAPELVRYIAGKAPGNAIDIGCGTGTNLLYLASHGWKVSGIDFSPLAIQKAGRKLRDYPKTLLVADVTKMAGLDLPGPYDLGLDMGCFHSLALAERGAYVKGMQKWITARGMLMIYAFQPSDAVGPDGITRDEMVEYFRNGFELVRYEQGQGRPSAWYTFQRK
ncbi:MAG: class I SAM-dependent methyltransferase [Anaerolineales bacterium]